MRKGLLAWWRGRIVARGLVGAALLAVPVGVAATIGFGTSLSGVVGGLSAVANGPDAVPATSQTVPTKLNRGVETLASKDRGAPSPAAATDGSGGTGSLTEETIQGIRGIPGGGDDRGGGPSSQTAPTINAPSAPQVELPSPDPATDPAVNEVNNGLNELLGGPDSTLKGLLGQ
jgi:hypothetical protein